MPKAMKIRGARVHNLKNISVDVPLNKIVAIAGVSGSGKSSLALGVLYTEGSRRYLDSLSTYTRRRMTQAAKAQVDEALYVPAALALHQRPGISGIRSTFGTGTELLNSLRLMFSRLANHCCPKGHYLEPTLSVAAGRQLVCPRCGERFYGPSAEELSFNSQGSCQTCGGTGIVRRVDKDSLVPDESLTIDEGAVAPWNSLMWSLMTDVCRAMGVRTDVPFSQLTGEEREIVYNGPAVKKHIFYKAKNSNEAGEIDFTYFNATYTVENALAKVKDEKGMKRVEKFLKQDICPDCGGTRLSRAARAPKLLGISLDEACKMTLSGLADWVKGVGPSLPEDMRPMAESICESFQTTAKRLMDLGLGYLSLDRASSTLSTGERQRMQLARAVRNRSTGVLYVLDEPSIGLHPSNIQGLAGVMEDLIADGNSVILVDHDTQILSQADWIIEMGPEAGAKGGYVTAQGTIGEIVSNKDSRIGPFLSGIAKTRIRKAPETSSLFDQGKIHLSTGRIHTVKPLDVSIPKGKLTVVTGVSGSGKTTLILESLVPGLKAKAEASRYAAEQEAAGVRARSEAEAAGIQAKGAAEAATIQAKLLAEAEGMEKKAEAYAKYNNAAVIEMMVNIMPQMAAEIAKPLSAIDKVNIYGGGEGSGGIGQVSGSGATVMQQVFDTMSEATGVDFREILKAQTFDAKVTRNFNVTGIDKKVDRSHNDSRRIKEWAGTLAPGILLTFLPQRKSKRLEI